MASNINWDNLSDELKEKAKACKTADEFVALADSEGVDLTDEQMEAISGGGGWETCAAACDLKVQGV